jgi:hypothetical protein
MLPFQDKFFNNFDFNRETGNRRSKTRHSPSKTAHLSSFFDNSSPSQVILSLHIDESLLRLASHHRKVEQLFPNISFGCAGGPGFSRNIYTLATLTI